MKKFVYSFNEGSKNMRELLGGKGANLAEMTRIGLPVPFGFTVTTEACNRYYEDEEELEEEIVDEICQKMEELENVIGKKFGDTEDPLLVSGRSGQPDGKYAVRLRQLSAFYSDVRGSRYGNPQIGVLCGIRE